MSSNTAAALQKFLESGHKNTKEIPEHLLRFILKSPSEPSSSSENTTSPVSHQPKRSRRHQGQPANDNRFPLDWCNIRTFRTVVRRFENEIENKIAEKKSITSSSPDPLAPSVESLDESPHTPTEYSVSFNSPTTIVPVQSSQHFCSYSLELLRQPIFAFSIQTASTRTQTMAGYRDAKTNTKYTKPYRLCTSKILHISTTPKSAVYNITTPGVIEVISITPAPAIASKPPPQPTLSFSGIIIIVSRPPSLPHRCRYRHHSTNTTTSAKKIRHISPWTTYSAKPVTPIMATIDGNTNGGSEPDRATDTAGFTPAQIQSIAAIVAETIRQERARQNDDNNQSRTRKHNNQPSRSRRRHHNEGRTNTNTRNPDPDDSDGSPSSSDFPRRRRRGHHRHSYSQDSNDDNKQTFKPNEIGLLWPDLPESYGYGEIVNTDSKIIYRSAFAFTNHLQVASQTQSIHRMARNLELCLCGTAQRWWNYELSNTTR
ncbi:hypothetical protein BDW71DRAFT_18520 [Aspergillus fruticulosus]